MRPRLVLFGASLTEQSFASGGWGAALADHFARQADVVLRGLSGYNTRWALKVLGRAMEGAAAGGADPAAVTVLLGSNDASLPDRAEPHLHVPLAEYQDNLRAICAHLKNKWPSAAIILITPPPIYEAARIRHIYGDNDPSRQPERTNEAAGTYAQACIAVAKELDQPFVDIWTHMQQFPDWQTSALCDGLHFTPFGNKILFDEVLKTLESIGFNKQSLPSDLPLYHEIDPKDPLKVFEI
ncbi:GDSL esterase/lipase At5g45920-like [Lolium rigidum]|uniref:GDSL esterase/lipase At5g45920-like n=1 Tax=Lolium rigidum TaxID=89674 RepID=UPI001F5CF9C5|nr:GDSL esterase/lipase At5g45920-like [Lolium rigidum]XP_051206512.1 GDSL esterase/lipase At5g45920-like [Lolium perenne]XP_051206519.1 GDSL esterase/lipase At5g45920-like [Lolium perenne]XP_051206525.1 GDSL esterase/lipase At5g45920-like [Lolium perenne]XP_051206530.1 GDSL esterase/lipase At5g45920-like [Lolium perenne]